MFNKCSFSLAGIVIASSFAFVSLAQGQMLGAPVLQNAFANPGITVGADFGSGDNISSYGAAVSWAPLTAKYALSGGIAYLNPKFGSGTATYGARLMVPVFHYGSQIGVAPFVGMGGATMSGVTEWQIPVGISAGYRRALGASGRGISAYVSPFYSWARVRESGATSTHGLFRVALGVDAAVLPQVGVSVGYETGATAGVGQAGATGGIFGLGVSYALHRPRPGEDVEKPRRRTPSIATDSTSTP
ncbi:MAG: hypothetical protein ABI889_13615 [Gemmatimonadota bacterium]